MRQKAAGLQLLRSAVTLLGVTTQRQSNSNTMTKQQSEATRSHLDNSPLGALRFSRAYTFTIEALHTMCCEAGTTRERLAKIDPEFFSLRPEDVPEGCGVRATFVELHGLATRLPPRWEGEGRIAATLGQSHHTKLRQIAQLIWEAHQNFSQFMQSDA